MNTNELFPSGFASFALIRGLMLPALLTTRFMPISGDLKHFLRASVSPVVGFVLSRLGLHSVDPAVGLTLAPVFRALTA